MVPQLRDDLLFSVCMCVSSRAPSETAGEQQSHEHPVLEEGVGWTDWEVVGVAVH